MILSRDKVTIVLFQIVHQRHVFFQVNVVYATLSYFINAAAWGLSCSFKIISLRFMVRGFFVDARAERLVFTRLV